MANWLFVKQAAKKFGVPEEQIREWIRQNYYEIEEGINENAFAGYADNEVTCVPICYIKEMEKGIAELHNKNSELQIENKKLRGRIDRVLDSAATMTIQTNSIIEKQNDIINKYDSIIKSKDLSNLHASLHQLFCLKRDIAMMNRHISLFLETLPKTHE